MSFVIRPALLLIALLTAPGCFGESTPEYSKEVDQSQWEMDEESGEPILREEGP